MKKLIILITLLISTSAFANDLRAPDYQSVKSVDHNAEQITRAAGDIPQKLYCKFMWTTILFEGEIRLETKDKKYRLSFNHMRSPDSGVLLADLPQMQEPCGKAMAKYEEDLYNKINNWSDF